jgi:AcrR family transcriptional regulator
MARKKKLAPKRRRKPSQARAQATVSAILEAALQILRSGGRAAFNTNRIAERAGVSIGTLYGYFPDKDAIYIALARQIIEEDRRVVQKILDGEHGAGPLQALIRSLLKRHREDHHVRRTVMSIYIAEGFGAEHDGLVEAIINTVAARSERLFGRSIPPLDPARLFVVSRAVIGVARALTEQSGAKRLPLKTIEDEVIRLVRQYLS